MYSNIVSVFVEFPKSFSAKQIGIEISVFHKDYDCTQRFLKKNHSAIEVLIKILDC